MGDNTNNRYALLVKAIIKHSLIVSSGLNEKIPLKDGSEITMMEWLAVETVVENRDEYNSMVELSRKMGLPPSSFFRIISHLQKEGLVVKYHIRGNKKNIVLRPTEYALELYSERVQSARQEIWNRFFEALEPFSDSDIAAFTNAINQLSEALPSAHYSQNNELIKAE